MQDGFISVAAATPQLRVADCDFNAACLADLARQGAQRGAKILVFPELALTGATCGDLFFQPTLLRAARAGLCRLAADTAALDLLLAVGLPVESASGALYNCAALLYRGQILHLVAQTNLSAARRRYFSAPPAASALSAFFGGREVPLTAAALVECAALPELCVGVEFGDDLFAPAPMSAELVRSGASVILDLAALPNEIGRTNSLRRALVAQSARLACGYVFACAGAGESVADAVCGGQRFICELGEILAEDSGNGLTISQLDLSRIAARRRSLGFAAEDAAELRCRIPMEVAETSLTRPVSPEPFFPRDMAREECCAEALELAALGLARRLAHTRAKTAVLGLSGGLDSTLAALIAARAMDLLERPRTDLLCVTMPCFGTTSRTRSNAEKLADGLGAALRTVDIGPAVKQHFADIGQDMSCHDVTFENAQARERTQVLMDLANQTGGLVIGTGDLSELALGWCTYNGDHMSMYSVNASIPKTMIRAMVAFAADGAEADLAAVLRDILATPVSPELLPAENGAIAQKTEDLVGPYELHDFFLYYVLKETASPRKIFRLALRAFEGKFDRTTILKWLKTFYRRFFAQQFKRNACPDGAAVTGLSLSPRGAWQMPSDACADLWLKELEELK